jgi:uncharacterized protein DUF1573
MKRFLGVLLAVLCISSAQAEEKEEKKGPRVSVDPISFDFGRAVQNKTLQKEFNVRNFGDEDLVIEGVTTTCGCTAAFMDEDGKVMKPGTSRPLRVTLQTREYSGKVARTVLVRTNDPTRKLVEIKVEATVVRP